MYIFTMFQKLFLMLVAMITLLSAQEAKRPMTVDDALDMIQVSNPQISPDGKWVLYSRSELKWKDNKRESRFFMMPLPVAKDSSSCPGRTILPQPGLRTE